jgi:hypothetical protein
VPVRQIIFCAWWSDRATRRRRASTPHASISGSTSTSPPCAPAIDSEATAGCHGPLPSAPVGSPPIRGNETKRKACGAGEAQDATARVAIGPGGGDVSRRGWRAPRAQVAGAPPWPASICRPATPAMANPASHRRSVDCVVRERGVRPSSPRRAARRTVRTRGQPWSDATGWIGPACHFDDPFLFSVYFLVFESSVCPTARTSDCLCVAVAARFKCGSIKLTQEEYMEFVQ